VEHFSLKLEKCQNLEEYLEIYLPSKTEPHLGRLARGSLHDGRACLWGDFKNPYLGNCIRQSQDSLTGP